MTTITNTMNSITAITEKISCPICGDNEYRVIYPAKHLTVSDSDLSEILKIYRSSSDEKLIDQLVSCQGCQLKYLNPRIKSEIIISSYKEAIDPNFISQNLSRIKTFTRVLKKLINKHPTLFVPTRETKILDIGCAGGAFPKAAVDLGFDATGIEPSKWIINEANKLYNNTTTTTSHLKLFSGTLEEHNFNKNSFDIITLWDVIEHLTNIDSVMLSIEKILKPKGTFVINFPDYNSIVAQTLRSRWPFLLNVHLYYFTTKTIKMLLEKYNFKIIQTSPYYQTLELSYVLKRATPYVGAVAPLTKLICKLGLGSIPLTYNLGQTMVVAQKK
ncbi:MAG: class I SAM-dependent methyltransferase [Oligoflexia bacterium]|nr:class I SAM-dependent methyltransferase [Oligoflexia bacterium]